MELKTIQTAARSGALLRRRRRASRWCFCTAPAASTWIWTFLNALAQKLPRVCAAGARLRRQRRVRRTARHAGFHAAHLGRGGRAGREGSDPGGLLHGRHDRQRNGRHRAPRCFAPGADRAGGPVAGRASHPGYLRDAAVTNCRSILFYDEEAGAKAIGANIDTDATRRSCRLFWCRMPASSARRARSCFRFPSAAWPRGCIASKPRRF